MCERLCCRIRAFPALLPSRTSWIGTYSCIAVKNHGCPSADLSRPLADSIGQPMSRTALYSKSLCHPNNSSYIIRAPSDGIVPFSPRFRLVFRVFLCLDSSTPPDQSCKHHQHCRAFHLRYTYPYLPSDPII